MNGSRRNMWKRWALPLEATKKEIRDIKEGEELSLFLTHTHTECEAFELKSKPYSQESVSKVLDAVSNT